MIEVQDLCKDYGDRKAIDHLNFKVAKGEVVGFLGPNGAGKTTTMKILTGFMAPTSGKVSVAGYDVFENPLEVKRHIGYLPELPPVYSYMFVQDYLEFVAKLRGVESKNLKRLVDLALEKTNLEDVRFRLIQNLSKGFRQRVGLAGALVSDPDILILDEPTVGLDPKQVADIRKLIQDLKGQHTIILSTHILPEVQATCEEIIIINKGKIIAQDSIHGLLSRIEGKIRYEVHVARMKDHLPGAVKGLSGVSAVDITENCLIVDLDHNQESIERLAEAVVQSGAGLLEMKDIGSNLEDVFIRLTESKSTLSTQIGMKNHLG